jgi:hypothetical protein
VNGIMPLWTGESQQLWLSTRQRQNDLRDESHREFVNRPFQFQKRRQLFIRTHYKTFSFAAMCVNNENLSTSLTHFE